MREVCRQISEFGKKLLLESLMCCRLFIDLQIQFHSVDLCFFFPPPEDLG
jgi:hypothetical protein